MADDNLSKSIKESGPQSPQSMYEALKYIVNGPGGGQDSVHLKDAADSLMKHHTEDRPLSSALNGKK